MELSFQTWAPNDGLVLNSGLVRPGLDDERFVKSSGNLIIASGIQQLWEKEIKNLKKERPGGAATERAATVRQSGPALSGSLL